MFPEAHRTCRPRCAARCDRDFWAIRHCIPHELLLEIARSGVDYFPLMADRSAVAWPEGRTDSKVAARTRPGWKGKIMPSFDPGVPDTRIPDGFRWGVDSFSSIRGLFARVKQQFGRAPDFWGRYIAQGRSSVLQKDEIPFLRANSPETRLVLIHNPLGQGFFHQQVKDGNGTVVGFTPNPDNEFNRGQKVAMDASTPLKPWASRSPEY